MAPKDEFLVKPLLLHKQNCNSVQVCGIKKYSPYCIECLNYRGNCSSTFIDNLSECERKRQPLSSTGFNFKNTL